MMNRRPILRHNEVMKMLVMTKEFVLHLLEKEIEYAMNTNTSPLFVLGLKQAMEVIENEKHSE